MSEFVHRIGGWVVWNDDDWSGSGWINLILTTARRIEHETPKCPRYRIGWNGERFAVGEAYGRIEKRFPGAIENLAVELKKRCVRNMHSKANGGEINATV